MIKQSPILITGCPRSGASMIAAAINVCGAFGGRMAERKMFTNDRILEEVIEPYFGDIEADLLGQYPLPIMNDLTIPMNWKQKVEQIIIDQGYEKGQWMYKDSKSSLVWPIWNYAFPNAKWIIVRRRTGDIIQSCLKTAFMIAFIYANNQRAIGVNTEQDGWLWWVHQYEKRFVEMIEAGLNCKVIWPERMVHGDYQQMYETLEWIGLSWNKEIVNLIDPLLWGSRQKERNK